MCGAYACHSSIGALALTSCIHEAAAKMTRVGFANHTFSGMLVAPQVVLVTMFMHYDHCLGQLWLCDIKVSIDFYSQHMLRAVALPA